MVKSAREPVWVRSYIMRIVVIIVWYDIIIVFCTDYKNCLKIPYIGSVRTFGTVFYLPVLPYASIREIYQTCFCVYEFLLVICYELFDFRTEPGVFGSVRKSNSKLKIFEPNLTRNSSVRILNQGKQNLNQICQKR